MWKIERNSEYQAKGGLNLSRILWQQRSRGFATREKEEEYWTPGAVISLEKFCARRKEKNQLEACFYSVALKLEINSIVFKLCTKEGINFFFFHKMKWVSIFREWNSHTRQGLAVQQRVIYF